MAACTFHDSYWYCFANSGAMLLSSIGETVSPRLIEVLTAVGLGASFNPPLPFFGELVWPDRGLSQAFDILGFDVEEHAVDAPDPAPLDRLRDGPVIVGPLDMSHLVYNPGRPRGPGVDHYVVILAAESGRYRMHDPAGFAHVLLDGENLARAWRADTIAYRRGHYRSWSSPRRRRSPSDDQIFDGAMTRFQALYRDAETRAAGNGECIGRDAHLALAKAVGRETLTPQLRGHLIFFALPLGAKRALDYAAFFERRAPKIAAMKRRQAELFGACHAALTAEAKPDAVRRFEDLATLEPEIKAAILAA